MKIKVDLLLAERKEIHRQGEALSEEYIQQQRAIIQQKIQEFTQSAEISVQEYIETQRRTVIELNENKIRKATIAGTATGVGLGVAAVAIIIGTAGLGTPAAIGLGIGIPSVAGLVGAGVGASVGVLLGEETVQELINTIREVKDPIEKKRIYEDILKDNKLSTSIFCISTCIAIIGKSLQTVGVIPANGLEDWLFRKLAEGLQESPLEKEELNKEVKKVCRFSDEFLKDRKLEFFEDAGHGVNIRRSLNFYDNAKNLAALERAVNAQHNPWYFDSPDEEPEASIAIPYNQLTFEKRIAGGEFGEVYKGEYQYNDVAIKLLKNQELKNDVMKEFKREAELMTKLNSSFIIRFYGACFEFPHYALVMEYMPKGSLFNVLQSTEVLNWKTRYQIGLDISAGVAYLHNHGVVHADLKSLNVLLDDFFRAKVSDFGLSKLKRLISSTPTPLMGTTLTGPATGGTIRWMAPELFEPDAKTTTASDVYSYGTVLWEIGSRQVPFLKKAPRNEQVPVLVANGMREDIVKDTPPTMAKLIGRCWDQRAAQRPKITEALEELKMEFKTYNFT
jgi:Protein tyrosine and serine/threonine kinase